MKRNEHIVSLSRDHHFGLLFGWKIRRGLEKAVDLKRIRNLVAFFWETELKLHFEVEEKFLFILQDDPLTEIARSEHTAIRTLVTEIVAGKRDKASDFTNLAALIESHIRFEERNLFPHLEKLFPPEKLEQIGSQLETLETPPRSDHADAFWLNR